MRAGWRHPIIGRSAYAHGFALVLTPSPAAYFYFCLLPRQCPLDECGSSIMMGNPSAFMAYALNAHADRFDRQTPTASSAHIL
jgi:hypothetical protein